MQPTVVHMIDELRMGGAQTHLLTILRYLKTSGRFRHVVMSLFNDGPVGDSLREAGIEVIVLDLAELIRRRQFLRARDAITDALKPLQPRLVESHLTYSRLLGLWAARRASVHRTIGYEHGDIYFNSIPWRLANFWGQRFADRIVVCSQSLGDWTRKTHGVSKTRLAVLHNCVDPERFRASASPQINRESLRLKATTFVYCAIGSLGQGVNKRVDVAIRAFALSRSGGGEDSALLICGDGPLRPELEALARQLGVAEHVRFLGMRKDVPDVIALSDAFVHTAPYEPFGIVCIEAMLMARPVIVPDSGGIREIFEHGQEGYKYPALDHKTLGQRMRELSTTPNLAREMGVRGRTRVDLEFTVERYATKLLELYQLNYYQEQDIGDIRT